MYHECLGLISQFHSCKQVVKFGQKALGSAAEGKPASNYRITGNFARKITRGADSIIDQARFKSTKGKRERRNLAVCGHSPQISACADITECFGGGAGI
jgi:hypothetical protein